MRTPEQTECMLELLAEERNEGENDRGTNLAFSSSDRQRMKRHEKMIQ